MQEQKCFCMVVFCCLYWKIYFQKEQDDYHQNNLSVERRLNEAVWWYLHLAFYPTFAIIKRLVGFKNTMEETIV